MKTLRLYTDGSCLKNPGGPGGWGFVLVVTPDCIVTKQGRFKSTTNNRMELTAVVRGLTLVSGDILPCRVVVYSDSQYVVEGMNQWIKHWVRRNWRSSTGRVKNVDLWEKILLQVGRIREARGDVLFEWLPGHKGHEYNEWAHALSVGLKVRKR